MQIKERKRNKLESASVGYVTWVTFLVVYWLKVGGVQRGKKQNPALNDCIRLLVVRSNKSVFPNCNFELLNNFSLFGPEESEGLYEEVDQCCKVQLIWVCL